MGRKGLQNFSEQVGCGLTSMLFTLLPIVVTPMMTELGGDGSSDLSGRNQRLKLMKQTNYYSTPDS